MHRTSGALLFVFFFLVAITGLVLGWKKNSGGLILAKSYQGKSSDPKEWLPIHVLQEKAVGFARAAGSDDRSYAIDRIDVRPDKGMVKFVFVEKYLGVQIDATTGDLLHVETRTSDLIENIHDGSAIDILLGMDGYFKLFYTTVMGGALIMFTVTGFWLWYGPKQFKHRNGR